MPTGYTADIEKGIAFEQFVMNCARAFGACVTMRDEPVSKEIPEKFEPSDYHLNAVNSAKELLAKLEKMSWQELDDASAKETESIRQRHLTAIKSIKRQKEAYENMLAKVTEWKPPTDEHQELKKFMVSQIEQSIDFDCDYEYHETALKNLRRYSADEWFEKDKERLLKDIKYHTKEYNTECERASKRTKWVSDLRGSLV